MKRPGRLATALTVAIVAAAGMLTAGSAGAIQPPPTYVTHSTAAASSPVDITGLDLHDGDLYEANGEFVDIGTEYGCGFAWQQTNTPWCGFGVAVAPTPTGPWSAPAGCTTPGSANTCLLFPPTSTDPETGTTWASECGTQGDGCFVPRMIQRSGWGANDGVWILWFTDPRDTRQRAESAYWVMGCNSPAGPCGASAGAPYGSTYKPQMQICTGNGDASFAPDGAGHMDMTCTLSNQTLADEQLDQWGANGTGTGATNLAGLSDVESSGVYQDPATGTWILTYSDRNCGYCEGDGTGYATASSPLGPWTAPANPGWGGPAGGRRDLSATSCGGQPDTVVVLGSQPYEKVDLWLGAANETAANTHLEPLTYRAPANTPGQPWQPFTPWGCS